MLHTHRVTRKPPFVDTINRPLWRALHNGREREFRSGSFEVVRLEGASVESVNVLPTEHCTNCGCELTIIAAILDALVIEKTLTHLGLQARALPRSPARGQALQAA